MATHTNTRHQQMKSSLAVRMAVGCVSISFTCLLRLPLPLSVGLLNCKLNTLAD